jgi:uncharacterized membrane protein
MSRSKTVLLYLMAAFYIFGGYNHLANPEFYLAIMPPNLPEPELLNVVAGLAEILLGVFLLDPRTRALAAWGIIALLVAVFPANVYAATANVGADGPGTGAGVANWIRLPFQIVFIAWAWWYTGPKTADE